MECIFCTKKDHFFLEREREQQMINKIEIDTTSSWSETSNLSLVVLDKKCDKKASVLQESVSNVMIS